MNRLEKILWTLLAVGGSAVAFWTVTLPDEEGRRLWNDHDPITCAIVGSSLIALCLLSLYRQVKDQS